LRGELINVSGFEEISMIGEIEEVPNESHIESLFTNHKTRKKLFAILASLNRLILFFQLNQRFSMN
jgi:arginine/ornithine N-succinyltransferase beta subunit